MEKYWDRKIGFISENDIDARWVLRSSEDEKAHGSLRIVSHPDLPPGHLRAFVSFVTARRPKTEEEKEFLKNEYQMEDIELEIYSIDEHIETVEKEFKAPLREIEKIFGVKIFN